MPVSVCVPEEIGGLVAVEVVGGACTCLFVGALVAVVATVVESATGCWIGVVEALSLVPLARNTMSPSTLRTTATETAAIVLHCVLVSCLAMKHLRN
jgi:hypothetical protein